LTSSTKAAARRVNSSISPASSSFWLIKPLPTPKAMAPFLMNAAAVFKSTPPTGTILQLHITLPAPGLVFGFSTSGSYPIESIDHGQNSRMHEIETTGQNGTTWIRLPSRRTSDVPTSLSCKSRVLTLAMPVNSLSPGPGIMCIRVMVLPIHFLS
jgi:hypothetical protein